MSQNSQNKKIAFINLNSEEAGQVLGGISNEPVYLGNPFAKLTNPGLLGGKLDLIPGSGITSFKF